MRTKLKIKNNNNNQRKKKEDQNAKRKSIMWIIIAIHGFMVVSKKIFLPHSLVFVIIVI